MICIPSERRLRRLEFTPDLLLAMCGGTFRITDNELPEGARVRSSYYDPEHDLFGLVIQSEEFDLLREGDVIPKVDPVWIERIA